jgi:hypothetical protein
VYCLLIIATRANYEIVCDVIFRAFIFIMKLYRLLFNRYRCSFTVGKAAGA